MNPRAAAAVTAATATAICDVTGFEDKTTISFLHVNSGDS